MDTRQSYTLLIPNQQEPMAISPGKRLGPFEIPSGLGASDMGEAYAAHNNKLGRNVKIKVPLEAFAYDADLLTRFQREAKVLAALNHPNIFHIHELERSDSAHIMIMEL